MMKYSTYICYNIEEQNGTRQSLTYWGKNNMVGTLQTTFSKASFWKERFVFWFEFQVMAWCLTGGNRLPETITTLHNDTYMLN